MNIFEDWDQFYMGLTFYVAMKSEDNSTHVGAVVVNQFNRAVSFGYNGLPTGVLNTPDKNIRPQKYFYFEHAERNAIYNSESFEPGCRVYVNMFPCSDCSRAIIQKRITKIIYHPGFTEVNNEIWDENHKASKEMLIEANVQITPYYGKIVSTITALKSEKIFEL